VGGGGKTPGAPALGGAIGLRSNHFVVSLRGGRPAAAKHQCGFRSDRRSPVSAHVRAREPSGFTLIWRVRRDIYSTAHQVLAGVAAWAAPRVLTPTPYRRADRRSTVGAGSSAFATLFRGGAANPEIARGIPHEAKEIFVSTATWLWGIMIPELIRLFTHHTRPKTVSADVEGSSTFSGVRTPKE